jgi:hypothetical protein
MNKPKTFKPHRIFLLTYWKTKGILEVKVNTEAELSKLNKADAFLTRESAIREAQLRKNKEVKRLNAQAKYFKELRFK